MSRKQEDFLLELDGLIKEGKGKVAGKLARKYTDVDFDAGGRAQFAAVARRLGEFDLAIRLLNPYVRPEGRMKSVATPRETAEYGAALGSIGAVTEALELLGKLNVSEVPESLLFSSHAHFSRWEYRSAIPLLFRYIEQGISDYQKLVGMANLGAALVFEEDDRAEATLTKLLEAGEKGSYRIICGYAKRLFGERAVQLKQWKEAREYLTGAEKDFIDSNSLELLFVRKWLAFVDMYEKGDVTKLLLVREEAAQRQHWETLRACDFHKAIALKDESLMLQVYFGTPYASIREKLLQSFGYKKEIPASLDWINEGKTSAHPPVDVLNVEAEGKLKLGQALYRILASMTSDFYRPIRSASLHALIYSGECFNPISSPHRVKQLIFRLRNWLSDNKVALEIVSKGGGYRVIPKAGESLRVYRDQFLGESFAIQIQRIKSLFEGEKSFSVHDVEEKMGLPLWTAKRLLKKAVEDGAVERRGKGKSTQYVIVTAKVSLAG